MARCFIQNLWRKFRSTKRVLITDSKIKINDCFSMKIDGNNRNLRFSSDFILMAPLPMVYPLIVSLYWNLPAGNIPKVLPSA
jgi:hypothetical protein